MLSLAQNTCKDEEDCSFVEASILVFDHSHGKKKKSFSLGLGGISGISVWVHHPSSFYWAFNEKILPPSSLLLLQVFLSRYKIPLKISSIGWTVPALKERFSSPLIIFTALCWTGNGVSLPLLYCNAQTQQSRFRRAQKRKSVCSFSLQVILLQPMRQLAFFATGAQTAVLFVSAELLSRQRAPSMDGCLGLLLPRRETGHFPLLNFSMLLSSPFSSLLSSFWMAAQPFGLWRTLSLYHQQICWGCTVAHHPGH